MKLDDALKCSATVIKLDAPENLSPVVPSAYRVDYDCVGSEIWIYALGGLFFRVTIQRPFGEYCGKLEQAEMHLVVDKEDWEPYP